MHVLCTGNNCVPKDKFPLTMFETDKDILLFIIHRFFNQVVIQSTLQRATKKEAWIYSPVIVAQWVYYSNPHAYIAFSRKSFTQTMNWQLQIYEEFINKLCIFSWVNKTVCIWNILLDNWENIHVVFLNRVNIFSRLLTLSLFRT